MFPIFCEMLKFHKIESFEEVTTRHIANHCSLVYCLFTACICHSNEFQCEQLCTNFSCNFDFCEWLGCVLDNMQSSLLEVLLKLWLHSCTSFSNKYYNCSQLSCIWLFYVLWLMQWEPWQHIGVHGIGIATCVWLSVKCILDSLSRIDAI